MKLNLSDAIYNWLQMHIVVKARPDDTAAKETEQFFYDILKERHQIEHLDVELKDSFYFVRYIRAGEQATEKYRKEFAEQLLHDIMNEPKYNG